MPTYMLCYGSAYKHLKEPFRRLMESLGCEAVTVFDHPEFGSVSDIALERIEKSNGCVALLGPSRRPEPGQSSFDLATWPNDEAKIALSHRKPVALIVHEGCELSGFGAADQAAARFDFWSPQSFMDNVHFVAQAFVRPEAPSGQDRRRADAAIPLQEGGDAQPHPGDGSLVVQYNHEAIVQEPRAYFAHELDSGGDLTEDAKLPAPDDMSCQIVIRASGVARNATIEWGPRTDHSLKYVVRIEPDLQTGEEVSYSRRFRFPKNRFPLTRAELARRAARPGFPERFPPAMYGDCYDVYAEIKELTLAMHFPGNVRIKPPRALVVESEGKRIENKLQTEKCRDRVRCYQDEDSLDTVVELKVDAPLMGHSYYILYEPVD